MLFPPPATSHRPSPVCVRPDRASRAGADRPRQPFRRLAGLAWAGDNNFIGVQDRGPNAKAWNASVADTTSFIGRFHSLRLQFSANAAGAPLPYSLMPTLSGTNLLSSPTALNDGAGGAPALNRDGASCFSGRSDNFAPGLSTNPNDARLDRFAIASLSASGAAEIANNSTGRVTYKGMEGMAITPDGTALIGFMQSPLAQDGGDGGQASSKAWRSVKT